jgi:hypothetical protein
MEGHSRCRKVSCRSRTCRADEEVDPPQQVALRNGRAASGHFEGRGWRGFTITPWIGDAEIYDAVRPGLNGPICDLTKSNQFDARCETSHPPVPLRPF